MKLNGKTPKGTCASHSAISHMKVLSASSWTLTVSSWDAKAHTLSPRFVQLVTFICVPLISTQGQRWLQAKQHNIMKIHVKHWRWVNSAVFTGGPSWLVRCVWGQVLKIGLRRNIVFVKEPRGKHKADRWGSGWCIYLCHTHRHIQRKKQAGRVLIFPCSLFWVSPHDGLKMLMLPQKKVFVSMCVSKC